MKNLCLLGRILESNRLNDFISIAVSNNYSTDHTDLLVTKFIEEHDLLNVNYYKQDVNIGLEANVLFLLKHSVADYVMFLGDDDYLDERYVLEAFAGLHDIKNLWCILPSFQSIDVEGNLIPGGRDLNQSGSLKEPGFSNLLVNSHRAHQISGIIVKRDGLFDEYVKLGVHNLYPQVFFTSYCCLRGRMLQITSYPVLVTQTLKKDWGYGKDGLVQEFFDNYRKIGVNAIQRLLLELQLLRKQPFRFTMYTKNRRRYLLALKHISFGKNTSLLGYIILPLYLFMVSFVRALLKILKFI